MAFANHAIGKEICDALGLKEVVDCDISLHLGDAAKVTVTYFPDREHIIDALAVVKKYKLVPMDD